MGHRVLHIIRGPWRRGAEVFTARLAFELHETGAENAVCSLYRLRGEEKSLRMDEGLPFYRVEAGENGLDRVLHFRPQVVLGIARVVREFKPDVVLTNPATLKYAALVKLMFPGKAVIFHSGGIASFWANTWWRRAANRLALRLIDRVVSVSESAYEDFVRHYGTDDGKVCYIPNGRDLSAFASPTLPAEGLALRSELGIGPEEPVLVTVGSLGPEKDQAALLALAADLHKSGVRAHVVMAGEGPLHGQLAAAATRLDIAPYVHLLGSRDDIPRVLAASDLFVLPSKTEGMPGVLIEAGMAGVASVAYDVGGVREVVVDGETGTVVPAGDLGALTRAVAELLADGERRRRMGAEAQARCGERFDIREVARQYSALFDELRAGRRRGTHAGA